MATCSLSQSLAGVVGIMVHLFPPKTREDSSNQGSTGHSHCTASLSSQYLIVVPEGAEGIQGAGVVMGGL